MRVELKYFQKNYLNYLYYYFGLYFFNIKC